MTEFTAPDFMPILSEGAHRTPAEGACIMEYSSFLAGEKWSDQPACVHPVLAFWSRAVNDMLTDEERPALLPLLGRLMGTATAGPDIEYADLYAALTQAGHANYRLFGLGRYVEFLTALLDEYDRLTGRTEVVEVTADDYRRMAELTSGA